MTSKTSFHSVAAAAWILGVSHNSVSRAIRTGALRATRCRSGLRVSSAELAKVLRNGGAAWTTSD